MARWIVEWVTVSVGVLLLMGLALVLWAAWPTLPTQVGGVPLSLDGLAATALLCSVGLGFLKLMVGR